MSGTIIHSFQQRRQLDQEIEALAATTSEPELLAAVRAIAHNYPINLMTAAIVKQLDTDDSQIRGGLGHLAALLPPEEITPLLRSAMGNRQLPAQSRVTAALFLERFLGETVTQALLSDLNQTNEIAFQSLREAVMESRRNRHILLEYVTQMRQAAQEIAFMVMQLLGRLEPTERAELLRLITYDERLPVAREAIRRLEQLATDGAENAALCSLFTLQYTLQSDLAQPIERAMRKLQFAGHRYQPPTAPAWRALLSPADPFGNQTIWFVSRPDLDTTDLDTTDLDTTDLDTTDIDATDIDATDGKIFGVITNEYYGILHAFGSDSLARENLPLPSAVGDMVIVQSDNSDTAVLLESPFEYGLWRLKRAIQAHWRAPQPRPLPGEFTLYNDWVLQFDPPDPVAELRAIFVSDESISSIDEQELEILDASASNLLAHPAMEGWATRNRNLAQALRPILSSLKELPPALLTASVLAELEKRPENKHLLAALSAGLRAQAAWLHISGSPQTAQYAVRLAQATQALPARQNPLLAKMISATLRRSVTDS